MGVEPTLSAWEAEVLPINYIRMYLPSFSNIAHKGQNFNRFFLSFLNCYLK